MKYLINSLRNIEFMEEVSSLRGTPVIKVKLCASASLLKKAAANVELKHSGETIKWAIERVFDVTTGQPDSVLTRGRNIRIEGKGLELAGPESAVEFTSLLGDVPSVTVPAARLAVNTPSLLVLDVPASLAAPPTAVYRISVITRYRSNKIALTPHTISHDVNFTTTDEAVNP